MYHLIRICENLSTDGQKTKLLRITSNRITGNKNAFQSKVYHPRNTLITINGHFCHLKFNITFRLNDMTFR